ncbi:MAG: hypothetical protein ABI599_03680 [Flavobacteriales bacterium]
MKRLFTTLLSVVGLSRPDARGQDIQTIDPSKILYTVPTISNDLSPVEKVDLPLPDSAFTLHEDDWCQVEFFTAERLPELQRMLKEYKTFESKNRTSSGWKNVYVRRIERLPVFTGEASPQRLGLLLKSTVGDAPILHATASLTGRVSNGFSMSLDGNIWLYGYTSDGGISVLAASVGEHPDDQVLTSVFATLHREAGLVLVDWKQQLLLVGVDGGGQIEVWQP